MPDFSLTDEVAVITGARRGIGKTLALALARAGAHVAVCDLVTDDGELDRVSEEIKTLGRRSVAIKVDTTRRVDVASMAQQVVDEFGHIDILVNNAGIIIKSPLLDMAEEDWDRLIGVDLKGYYLCAQAVGKKMVEQGKGKIVSVASQYAFKVTPGMGAYSIAKAGVVMLTRVLAQELGKHGVRANAIAPGMIRTEFSRPSWSDAAFLKQYETSMPVGRIGETNDLVGAALFLASEASSYVTGHTIVIDGGAIA